MLFRAVGLSLGLLSGLSGCREDRARKPVQPPTPTAVSASAAPRGPEVIAWVVPYEDSLRSLERHAPVLSIASPAYYRLAVTGKTAKLEDWDPGVPFPRARFAALRAGASYRVYPLVGCIGECGPKISRVLDDDEARRRHVAELASAAARERADGLFIDYEDVDARATSVTAFFSELAKALHSQGKHLAVAVQEPCGVAPKCKRDPFPFVLKDLATHIDLLAIMEYDFAVDGSSAPAPREWVSRGLANVALAVGDAALAKVVCAVPYYGRMTAGIAGDSAVLFADVGKGRIRNVDTEIGALTYDPAAIAKVGSIRAGAKSGKLYLEDHETLAARLALIKESKLGGVAIWRLGSEDPCNASELARYRGTTLAPSPPCPAPAH